MFRKLWRKESPREFRSIKVLKNHKTYFLNKYLTVKELANVEKLG